MSPHTAANSGGRPGSPRPTGPRRRLWCRSEHPRRGPPGPAALGIDLSIAQLTVTREAAAREQVGNATFIQADAQVHPSQVHVAFGAALHGNSRTAAAPVAARPGAILDSAAWLITAHRA